jgi:hypothetical protein
MARGLVHATAAVELILSASIAGVVSTGPEDAADGFEAGQSHPPRPAPGQCRGGLDQHRCGGRPRWRGSATVGLGGQVILTMGGMPSGVSARDRVADAVMAPLANVTCISSRSIRCRLLAGRRDVSLTAHRCAGAAVTTARPPRNWYRGSLLISRRPARNESTRRSRRLHAGVL